MKGLHSLKKFKESALFIDSVALGFAHVPRFAFRWFYPYSATIEMTNACMARCELCNVTCATKRKRGLMKYEDFVKIIDSLPKTTKEIYLNYAGEPLMNKDVFNCAKYAKKKGLYVYISTNAELLDRFTPKEICDSGVDDLAICIDGPTAEVHERYRRFTHFDRICAAAKKLNDYKIQHKIKKPNTIFQTLINKQTYELMDDTVALAKKLNFDEIDFRTTYIPGVINKEFVKKAFPNYKNVKGGKKDYLIEEDNEYNAYEKDKKGNYKYKNARRLCSFYNPTIFWNGDLGVCCNDPDGTLVYGNVLTEGFEKAYKKLNRRKICFMKYDVCKPCFKSCYYNIGVKKLR